MATAHVAQEKVMKAFAAVVVGMLAPVLAACASATGSQPPAGAATTPPPAQSPVADVATPAATLPAFQCNDQTGGGSARSDIVAVRVGSSAGYDRFVVQFAGDVPGFKVLQSGSPNVVEDASGRTVTLQGASSLRVVLNPSGAYGSYNGPNDFTPAYPILREARQIGDFEAVTTWGLGLSKPACFRSFTLTSPSRLVVDVQAS
jgi:hypothetical protein